MQSNGEKNTPPKEKVNKPLYYKYCYKCFSAIPINAWNLSTGFCPLCGTRLADYPRKEQINKNE